MAIKIRDYEVRLTRSKEERRMVRQLRYRCFVEEEGASATEEQRQLREEYDSYDTYADYMGVFHNGQIVGTYRIIDREIAEKTDGFYTESEYDLRKIRSIRGNIGEMSRACVDPAYRDAGLVMRLLWLGLGEYCIKNKIVILFGVASWVGTNPAESVHAISYLYYNHLAPLSLRATVKTENFAEGVNPKLSRMKILPREFADKKIAESQMTPLVKGYLRLGADFGSGVFIDKPFNTYDVFVTLQTKKIASAYQKRFTGDGESFDRFKIKYGPFKTFGKIMSLPFTGVAALAKLLLKPDDIADAELERD
ncbi:MAG: GNAT family N-acetyltransferase [Rickettsiales bacterium]|nr:GNAT family N-acetyltransferase [Rickettsiales bacterium]